MATCLAAFEDPTLGIALRTDGRTPDELAGTVDQLITSASTGRIADLSGSQPPRD
jgi:hypothetical protein